MGIECLQVIGDLSKNCADGYNGEPDPEAVDDSAKHHDDLLAKKRRERDDYKLASCGQYLLISGLKSAHYCDRNKKTEV